MFTILHDHQKKVSIITKSDHICYQIWIQRIDHINMQTIDTLTQPQIQFWMEKNPLISTTTNWGSIKQLWSHITFNMSCYDLILT
jgi:hypothetical protein